jgi:hypothetical protein
MNLQETIARIFPAGVVRDGDPDRGNSFEVHGLPKNAVPQNCEVLASGKFQFAVGQESRESYLVKTDGCVLFLRICVARPGSSFAEVAPRRTPAL